MLNLLIPALGAIGVALIGANVLTGALARHRSRLDGETKLLDGLANEPELAQLMRSNIRQSLLVYGERARRSDVGAGIRVVAMALYVFGALVLMFGWMGALVSENGFQSIYDLKTPTPWATLVGILMMFGALLVITTARPIRLKELDQPSGLADVPSRRRSTSGRSLRMRSLARRRARGAF